ncbi:uncharacterized protein BJ212DRAFT_274593 [Suillus subaureus]|uniref:Uncharacterized protein n=1 Tax=Suillus subaureus TaxID=48587 RepID=A0A9P7JIX6_9AGAM|nr:uncharacterized protein BJ212DRAFT_274593 [Suillus subaureus]KAG1825432.1 hypothetical protein BJ212DRAFT_274593 [Suillus subaureus]
MVQLSKSPQNLAMVSLSIAILMSYNWVLVVRTGVTPGGLRKARRHTLDVIRTDHLCRAFYVRDSESDIGSSRSLVLQIEGTAKHLLKLQAAPKPVLWPRNPKRHGCKASSPSTRGQLVTNHLPLINCGRLGCNFAADAIVNASSEGFQESRTSTCAPLPSKADRRLLATRDRR